MRQLWANRHGTLTFSEEYYSDFQNNRLDNAPFVPTIAAFWVPQGNNAGRLWELQDIDGDGDDDRLIIQWNVVTHAERGIGPFKFQAILELNTRSRPGDITFNYVTFDEDADDRYTVGIKDGGYSSNRLLVAYHDASHALAAPGKAIRIRNVASGQPIADAVLRATPEGPGPIRVQLSGVHSSDPNQSSDRLNYAWDLDLDGAYGETSAAALYGDEVGMRPTYVRGDSSILNGTQRFQVALRVTDASGVTSFDHTEVVVRNVAPVASIAGPDTAPVSQEVGFDLAMVDPGRDWNGWAIQWGDDRPSGDYADENGLGSDTHVWYVPGTYTITVTANDRDGGVHEVSRTITITDTRPALEVNSVGVLIATLGDGDDTVSLGQQGTDLRLDRNGTVSTYALADLTAVNIDAGGGSNTLTVNTTARIPVTVMAGDGNDAFDLSTVESVDTIFAGGGDNTITASGQTDIRTGDGDDAITSDFYAFIRDSGGNNRIDIPSGDVVTGGGNDTIKGGGSISSGDGDDFIDAGSDTADGLITEGDTADNINCGNGADTVLTGDMVDFVTAGGDPVTGFGAFIDTGAHGDRVNAVFATTVLGGDGDYDITVQAANVIDGGDDRISALQFINESIDAGAGDDLVRVGSDVMHPALLRGGDGDDDLFTGAGSDSIYGGAGRDAVHAAGGSDLLSGGGGHDLLFGQGGADRLYGGEGNDRLFGQGGNDRLSGGAGVDMIHGGAAVDLAETEDEDVLESIEGDLVA